MERKWLATFLISTAVFVFVIGVFLWTEGYFSCLSLQQLWPGSLPIAEKLSGPSPAAPSPAQDTTPPSLSMGEDASTSPVLSAPSSPVIPSTRPESPSPEEILVREISVSLDLEQYDEALKKASSYLSLYPEGQYTTLVLTSVATVFYHKRQFSEALSWCHKAISRGVSSDQELRLASLVGFILKDMEKYDPPLLAWMEQVLLRHPEENTSTLTVGIAYQYLYNHAPQIALSYLQDARGELATLGRARAYIAMNNYPAAIQEYENFFAFYPESTRKNGVRTAFLRQTLSYASQNESQNPSLALKYYEKLKRFPEALEAEEGILRALRLLRQQKRYAEAITIATEGLSNPVRDRDPEILFEMAGCFYEMGQKEKAKQTYEKLVSTAPSHPLASQAREWVDLITKEMATPSLP